MARKRFPTKIIPPHHEQAFAREKLCTLVNQHRLPLVWVNGPPGAGKTVFTVGLLNMQKTRFLWYRMDSGKNNLTDLFYFLSLAAERNYPRKRLNLPVFTSEYANNIEDFARIFFRQLFVQLSKETAIVLDNCQEAEQDEDFYKVLLIAVSELPHNMQIYCLSRNRPNTALSRMQINNELLEIGAAELQFNIAESMEFLQWLNPQLDNNIVQKLQLITRGWAAGMVLLAEPVHVQKNDAFNSDFHNNETIFDYLLSEILVHLEIEALEFLVKTALFEQLTVEMGKQLSKYSKTQQFLDDLVNKNLLIERTAGSKPVYTYHPLFRETLLTRADTLFNKQQWCILQRKAADILVKQKRPIEAMSLYLHLKDWLVLENLLLQHANTLIKNGRHRSVSLWVEAFPDDYLVSRPWVKYWYAEAMKPVNPMLAATQLDHCYLQFIADNDTLGVYSSWQSAVESISISNDDYSGLAVWVERFDELRDNYPGCPSLELKAKFYGTAVQALSFYNPQHSWLKGLVKLCERTFRIIPVRILRLMICTQLGHYHILCCELNKQQVMTHYLEEAIDDESLPTIPRILNTIILGAANQFRGNGAVAQEYFKRGIALSDTSGISLFKGFLSLYIVSSHVCNGDLKAAQQAMDNAIEHVNPKQRMPAALYHSIKAWMSALAGEPIVALEHNEVALQMAHQINMEVGYICSLAYKAQFLADLSQWDKAQQTFELLGKKMTDNNTNFNQIQYHYTDAWLGYLSGNQDRAILAVRRFLEIVRAEQVLFFFGWRPDIIGPLCILAIENNIETDFAVRLMRLNHLVPSTPIHLEQWPWSVRIYCFECLQIEFGDHALEHTAISPKKTNELLAAIISLGGRDVESDQLVHILWPDSDGDMAQQSLETAIHRLRKLVGPQAILVKAGKISINSNYCWLDLWAFEAIEQELKNTFLQDTQYHLVVKLTDRLLNLYRGPFLNDINSGAVILKREQLQDKLYSLINQSATYHEQRQEMNRAGYLLEKGLELEPLLEANYIRLMTNYIKLNQTDRALKTYRQCRRILFEGFDIPLSENIEALALQLKE